jgi:sulfhydrogenase subunit beta (sulfur reductase)
MIPTMSETVWCIDRHGLQLLIDRLIERGHEVVGPRIDQGAIVYDTIRNIDELPVGWTDDQQPGVYRIQPRQDQEFFGYNVGPHSWKKYLFPPLTTLMRSRRTEQGWAMEPPPPDEKRYALLGVRACELAALAVQDRVFCGPGTVDPLYQLRRSRLFIIAVQCTQAAATCFCTSMGTGPECRSGFDLALTELEDGFLMEIGSEAGSEVAESLPKRPASPQDIARGEVRRQRAVDQITRQMNTEGIRDRLLAQLNHPHWEDVAQRCLSCANCTMVCPTCFCHSVDDVHELTDEEIVRQRRWDSCFNVDFSHVAGGPVRDSIRSRYRQWLTHKLATWIDQFGTSGCVGCGRCITWCPVGIDLTREVAVLCEEKKP